MFCRLLLVAGNETTTGLIVNAVRAFSEFPEVYERVRREPELVPAAIEEALRWLRPLPGHDPAHDPRCRYRGHDYPCGPACHRPARPGESRRSCVRESR